MSRWSSVSIPIFAAVLSCQAPPVPAPAAPEPAHACPEAPPSYRADVVPALQAKCLSCHAGNGEAAEEHDFSTFEKVHAARQGIQRKVLARAMPPAVAPGLRESERDVLLAWLACQAPNN
jgi:uncharacterized membrane protein